MDKIQPWISVLSDVFLVAIGLLLLLLLVIVFIRDVTQTRDAVLRNYPVIGHFRYIFSTLGEFFRQYFFAMDREELPFNRAEREWIQRSTNDKGSTIAFGSTRSLLPVGTAIFENHSFPMLDEDTTGPTAVTIGEGYCDNPYTTSSVINISAMSFGAISRPAVTALSGEPTWRGAGTTPVKAAWRHTTWKVAPTSSFRSARQSMVYMIRMAASMKKN